MITITNISQIKTGQYDEIWAIMRSVKNLPESAIHVPELSPSWDLLKEYLNWKKKGQWDAEKFQSAYMPRFLQELQQSKAHEKLSELVSKHNQGKHICLYCVCPNESLCHRSLIAGVLQSLNIPINGVFNDYSEYGKLYWDITPICKSKLPSIKKFGYQSLCFTGSRPKDLCGYKSDCYRLFVKQCTEILEHYYEQGIRTFLSGGAQGFDQLAFWAVHRLKQIHSEVENIIYVPFPGQESLWAQKGCFSKQEYHQMIKYADKIVYCQEEKPRTKAEITKALLDRNKRMVMDTDIVFALQPDPGWETATHGGTAACMQFALKNQKPIH